MVKKKGREGKGKHKPPGEEPAEPEEVDPDASDEEVAESDYVKPALPWEQEIVEWMGKRENRLEVVDTVRQRYLAKNNTTLMSEAEWLLTAEGFMRPYKPRAELMVQMLTTVLCRSAVRRGHVSDNPNHISAALRWQKDVLSHVDPFIGSGGAGFGAGGHNPGWQSKKSKNNTNAHTHATRTSRTHIHAHSRAHLKYYVYCDSMVSHQTHWINIDDSQRIMLHAPRRRTNSFWDMQIRDLTLDGK